MQTLDFDKLLDPIHDKHMLVPGWRLTDDCLVTRTHPPASLGIRNKRLAVCFVIVQIAQYDGGTLDEQFTRLVVTGYFFAVGGYDSCFD